MKIKTELNISYEILTCDNDTNLTCDNDTWLTYGTNTVTCHNTDLTHAQFF